MCLCVLKHTLSEGILYTQPQPGFRAFPRRNVVPECGLLLPTTWPLLAFSILPCLMKMFPQASAKCPTSEKHSSIYEDQISCCAGLCNYHPQKTCLNHPPTLWLSPPPQILIGGYGEPLKSVLANTPSDAKLTL